MYTSSRRRYAAADAATASAAMVAQAPVERAVPRERRFCLPNTRFLIHQPSGGAGGQASDIAIHAQEIIKARERIAKAIARETGKPLDVVLADIERDRWLSAQEAVDYGLVGRIIEHKTEIHRR